MSLFLLLISGLAAILLLGGLLLASAIRGRPVPATRVCRKCKFDLASNSPTVCPECGSDLSVPNASAPRRIRSKTKLANGLVLTILPLLAASSFLVVAAATSNFNPYKPVWLLSAEADGLFSTRPSSALAELTVRMKAGTLTNAQIDSLVSKAMTLRTTPNIPWNSAWSDFLEPARAAGRVSDDQWVNYVRYSTQIVHQTRPKIRTAAKSPATITFAGSQLGTQTPTRLRIMLQARVTNRRIGDHEAQSPDRVGNFSVTKHGTNGTTDEFRCDAPPGNSEIRTSIEVSVIDPANPKKMLGSWQQDFVSKVEVVDADADIIEVKNVPADAGNVKRSLTIQSVVRKWMGDTWVTVGVNGAPYDLAFDVFLRPHGTNTTSAEMKLGQISFVNGTSNASHQVSLLSDADYGDFVDIILRPSVSAAENNTALNSVWLGPDLVFENIKITRTK